MRQIRGILISTAAILALMVAPAVAQMVPTPPPSPGAPAAQPPGPPKEKQVQGPVKKIDPAGKTVQVGWFLGLFRTTLEVTDDTHIAVEGMKASLQDIREGAKVKAAYETRDGKNIAKFIEVMPAEQKEKATSSGDIRPPMTPPTGASTLPSGRPGTE